MSADGASRDLSLTSDGERNGEKCECAQRRSNERVAQRRVFDGVTRRCRDAARACGLREVKECCEFTGKVMVGEGCLKFEDYGLMISAIQ